MKVKIFIGLIVLVLGTVLFVLCKPEPADAEMDQVKKIELSKMKGLDWTPEQERNALAYLKEEIEDQVEKLFEKKRFQQIGLLLQKHGVVITLETGGTITGKTAIREFFEANSGRTISFGNEEVIAAGTIDKTVGGHKVNKWAVVEFDIHFTNNATLQNQTHGGRGLLLHRNDCPWNG